MAIKKLQAENKRLESENAALRAGSLGQQRPMSSVQPNPNFFIGNNSTNVVFSMSMPFPPTMMPSPQLMQQWAQMNGGNISFGTGPRQ